MSNNYVPIVERTGTASGDQIQEMKGGISILKDLSSSGTVEMNPQASMKDRIRALENYADISQHQYQATNTKTLDTVDGVIGSLEAQLVNFIYEERKRNTDSMMAMRKEFEHQFELQASENKRLIQSVKSLKAHQNESNRKQKLIIERLRKLQEEFGDQMEDDPFGTMSSSQSLDGKSLTEKSMRIGGGY